MAAATGLDLLKSGFKFTGSQWELIAIGFITAFVSAIIAVKSFLSFVKHHDFTVFAIYRIAVAAAFFWFIAK